MPEGLDKIFHKEEMFRIFHRERVLQRGRGIVVATRSRFLTEPAARFGMTSE
jgi:hypothetical protein